MGAYATYSGEASSALATANMTMRIEIVDLNSTHAKLLVYQKVNFAISDSVTGITPNSSPVENQETFWVDLPNIANLNIAETPIRTTEEHVYIEGFGTRYCIIKEYDQSGTILEGSKTFTIYVDKETGWILKMKWAPLDTGSSKLGLNSLELNIEETNIPDLG